MLEKIKVMIKVNDLVSVFQFGTDTFKVKRIQGNNVLIQGANKATTTVNIHDCMKKTFRVIEQIFGYHRYGSYIHHVVKVNNNKNKGYVKSRK